MARGLWALLSAGYAAPGVRVGSLLRTFGSNVPVRHVLAAGGLTASTPAGWVTAKQWYLLAVALRRTPSVRWPPLPRRLR